MNHNLYQEIEEAASKLQSNIRKHGNPTSLRQEICSKYTDQRKKSIWIWENTIDSYDIFDANAIGLIGQMPLPKEIIFFFNENEDPEIAILDDSTKLVPIIMNCTGFEFYLTDEECTFLLCFNHHDVLSGSGLAKVWLKNISPPRPDRS